MEWHSHMSSKKELVNQFFPCNEDYFCALLERNLRDILRGKSRVQKMYVVATFYVRKGRLRIYVCTHTYILKIISYDFIF